jgi:hypothetical protein
VLIEGVNDTMTHDLALAQSTSGETLGIVRRLDSHATATLWKAEKWLAVS